jgi:putative endonuclease
VTGRRRALGTSGEDLAAAWYEANGYDVLARNWRCREGELDLVVGRGRDVVFCEVKARTSDAFGLPAEAVSARKQARIRGLAVRWLGSPAGSAAAPRSIRFDVASVLGGTVEVLEGAF